ncbi:MAG: GntR family transcriptional regulator [Verrucomicrobiota bacterium]
MLPFSIHLSDGTPVSDQILLAVKRALLMGQLRPGDLFPSVRTLSQELTISPSTAHKVVAQLKDAGWLNSRPGIGMVVTEPDQPEIGDRLEQITPLGRELLREADRLNLTLDQVIEHLKSL